MPVSGSEIASLDFSNLIGGPLNAIVEAQAKSAITTVNFIKEVAFDNDGKVRNVDFAYNRKNENGKDQIFTMTVPFLTMLPVPYITINNALVEFNAKITSINESSMSDDFKTEVEASGGGSWWFCSARVTSKTSYQRKSSTSEKAERAFDMHVKVEASNQDMPPGTEHLLTILENCITEKNGPNCMRATVVSFTKPQSVAKTTTMTIDCDNIKSLQKNKTYFTLNKKKYTINDFNEGTKELTVERNEDFIVGEDLGANSILLEDVI